MKRDDIIRMAGASGIEFNEFTGVGGRTNIVSNGGQPMQRFERFAKLVAKAAQLDLRARLAAAEAEVVRLRAQRDEAVAALSDLLTDVAIAQGNMRHAARRDAMWEGCAEAIQPRVDAARATLASLKEQAA